MDELQKAKVVVELLRQTSTRETLQEFLKSKGLPFSGTWEELRDKRILPAVRERRCSVDDLVQLLRSAEEHGRQHIFLFKCDPDKAVEAMCRNRIRAALQKRGEEGLLDTPKILDNPDTPTLTDVRWASADVDLSLILKEVETRESRHPLREERSADGKILTKTYEIRRQRAVNVIRLHRDGLLEMRIAARSTGSTKYKPDMDLFWYRMRGLLHQHIFRPVILESLKTRTVCERQSLSGRIRFSNSNLRNEDGTTMTVSSRGLDANLYDDNGATNGMMAFLDADGHCEGANFFFRKNNELSKDIHILLTGEPHEFAITADCSEGDYEYVLRQIRALNTRISGGVASVASLEASA